MKIESIAIENYKVFEKVKIENIPPLAVFLGVNGSGKSTFFDVFGFLKDALHNNVSVALERRGGFKEVLSRGKNMDKDLIKFEIKFRNSALESNDTPPLVTYQLEIGKRDGKNYIHKEVLKYRRGSKGKPWNFLNFENGEGYAITNEDEYGNKDVQEKRVKQKTSSPDVLAIKGLGQFEQYKTISAFRNLLEKWYISDFRIEAARQLSDTGISQHLSESGDNLAQVTKYIYENHKATFDSILETLPKKIPGIERVEAKETEDGRIILKFGDSHFRDPFIARFVSDGTLKMFAYLVLLNEPEPHPLICIQEPENFLYLDLLLSLCEEIRNAAQNRQIFVSTHSPDFVNGLYPDELFLLKKQNGFSVVEAAKDMKRIKELYEAGSQLGWLWRNGYMDQNS